MWNALGVSAFCICICARLLGVAADMVHGFASAGEGSGCFLRSQPDPVPHPPHPGFPGGGQPGRCTYEDLEAALNLSNSTVSRTVHALGDTRRRGYDGHGLLETFRDPDEGRRFMVRLTAKGKALVRQLEGL